MSLQVKYSPVLALAKDLNIRGLDVKEDAGKLKLSGTVNTQYEKNVIWDKIKEVGGEGQKNANKDQLTNPDNIKVGQQLKIPNP